MKAAVEEAANSINWVHQIAGFPAITESPFVHAWPAKETGNRVKNEPVTSDMLGGGKFWTASIIE